MEAIDAGSVAAMIFYLKTQGKWREVRDTVDEEEEKQSPIIRVEFVSTNRDEQEVKYKHVSDNELEGRTKLVYDSRR